VFADIGTSVYYTPGILFQQVGSHAALFVDLTFVVFVLLAIKYSEVAIRYPEGGGVVTVATRAINPIAGLLGGLFILVDYFLTAGLSATSGMIYLSVVYTPLKGAILLASVAALLGLGLLNLIGIRASAGVTAAIAIVAAAGQLLVVIAVVASVSPARLGQSFSMMLTGPPLGPDRILVGYAGAFLAFSGLESITQLAPAMAEPRKRTARLAMVLVVLSLLVTSPLLTLWSTTLLKPGFDPDQSVSLLGGLAAGPLLQNAVAVSGALLLVFACNTALIGCYHVLIALSRMRFLPGALLAINRWRQTPHWSILLATLIPILVVIVAGASTGFMGELYAFGLLGAFSVTCLSLDIIRWQERKARRPSKAIGRTSMPMFLVGVVTTVLVVIPWLTNLVVKPKATVFGGGIVLTGLLVAFLMDRRRRRRGQLALFPYVHRDQHPVLLLRHGRRVAPVPVLALLPADPPRAAKVIVEAIAAAHGREVAFVYCGRVTRARRPRLLEILDPYADDKDAQSALQQAAVAAREHHLRARYVYVPKGTDSDVEAWLREDLKPEVVVGSAS
jgi:amino acid transporter